MQICKHLHAGPMGFDSCLATFIINWSADKSFPEMLCFVGACSEAPSDLSSIPIMIIAVVIPLNNSKSIKNLSYSSIEYSSDPFFNDPSITRYKRYFQLKLKVRWTVSLDTEPSTLKQS